MQLRIARTRGKRYPYCMWCTCEEFRDLLEALGKSWVLKKWEELSPAELHLTTHRTSLSQQRSVCSVWIPTCSKGNGLDISSLSHPASLWPSHWPSLYLCGRGLEDGLGGNRGCCTQRLHFLQRWREQKCFRTEVWTAPLDVSTPRPELGSVWEARWREEGLLGPASLVERSPGLLTGKRQIGDNRRG